ncbi:hemin uptake protein HemP [Rhodopseudomonas sp. P2A-2r]|uniref:hemin uptake protein HemP n=1 Tax=unclassified Rhodopseudomonas TaxID=2638247 RepID=UPI002233F012|nr:hemin uptake protein HemP [Rhodopseudomonas sp. P2A-2r]UZE50816.1 hemin uptake protein HemP [Rhodopseudomonas sp. P2A-2r]
MTTAPRDETHDGPQAPAATSGAERHISVQANRIDSGDLFETGREITIAHGHETYRLRLTSQNKLILTK